MAGAALALGTLVGSMLVLAPSADATPTLTVTPTTTVLVAPNSSVTLTGLGISGDTVDTLQATVATSIGTLTVSTTTGLTLAYANSWSGSASVTFTGSQSAIDTALGTTSLVTTSATGNAVVSLTAMVAVSGYNYLASNQHFYEYVADSGVTWTAADADAKLLSFDGQPGYLATIPSATVNTFISTDIANATNVWFGARAYESIATDGTQVYATVAGTTYGRVWRWTEGADESPIAGGVISECPNITGSCTFANFSSFYSSWNSGEPNNSGGSATVAYQGEYVPVTNWGGTSGAWNDLPPTNNGASGYVVEFGGKTNSNASLGTGFAGVVTASSTVVVAAAATVPGAATVTATPANSSATLSWSPPVDGGAAITSYQYAVNGGTWTTVATSSSTILVNGNNVTTVTATVPGLTNATSYTVEIRALNSVGNGAASNSVSVTPVGPPDAPTAVSGTSGNGSVSVAFTAPANNGGATISSYTVTSSPGGVSATCSASPCVVSGLTNGAAYTFTVHATSTLGSGVESSPSSSVTPATVPNAPTAVSGARADGSAVVSWTAPVDDGGSPVTSYTVTSSPGGATATCTVGPCVVPGLTNGTAYTFTVHATNQVGSSAESLSSGAVTPAAVPDPPTGVGASADDGAVTVTFTPAANVSGSPVTSYTVTSSPGGVSATCSTSPCVVPGLINGTTYIFTVHATNGVGSSAESLSSAAVTPAGLPGAPSALLVTSGPGAGDISFDPPATNGSAITGYEVSTDGGTTWQALSTTGVTPLSATITGLVNGTTYNVEVRAVNGVGAGPVAGPQAVTPMAAPGAPTDVSAVVGNGAATVSFTVPPDNGSVITGFTVTVSPGGESVSCSTSPCVFGLLTDGTVYTFTVFALSSAGAGPRSASSASVTPAGPPSAPGHATAVIQDGDAVVSWTAPSALHGATITGYTVTASPADRTCTPTPATATTCVVTGLDPGVQYTFTVVAHSTAGDSAASVASQESDLVSDLALTGVSLMFPVTGGLVLVLMGTWMVALGERQRRRRVAVIVARRVGGRERR